MLNKNYDILKHVRFCLPLFECELNQHQLTLDDISKPNTKFFVMNEDELTDRIQRGYFDAEDIKLLEDIGLCVEFFTMEPDYISEIIHLRSENKLLKKKLNEYQNDILRKKFVDLLTESF